VIRAVIWDMGGILYPYFTELMLEEGEERGWPLDRLPLGPTGRVRDPAYEDLLEGRLDEPGYVAAVVGRLVAEGISFDPVADIDWTDCLRPAAWKTIRRLADRGLVQGLLTNDATRWLGER